MRTSLICLKWLGIYIKKITSYTVALLCRNPWHPTQYTSHLSKLVFSKTIKVVIFHFEVMITNIVYILKTYFFLFHIFWPSVSSFHAHLLALSHMRMRISSESLPWRRKFSHRFCQDSIPRPLNHKSITLTTELSPLPHVYMQGRMRDRVRYIDWISEWIYFSKCDYCQSQLLFSHNQCAPHNHFSKSFTSKV